MFSVSCVSLFLLCCLLIFVFTQRVLLLRARYPSVPVAPVLPLDWLGEKKGNKQTERGENHHAQLFRVVAERWTPHIPSLCRHTHGRGFSTKIKNESSFRCFRDLLSATRHRWMINRTNQRQKAHQQVSRRSGTRNLQINRSEIEYNFTGTSFGDWGKSFLPDAFMEVAGAG